MFHYFGRIESQFGDAQAGWQVEVVQLSDGSTTVPIFADENGTPIETVSGVTDRAVSDDLGNYDLYVPSGTYSLRFYNETGVFQRSQRYLPMYGDVAEEKLVEINAAVTTVQTAVTDATNAKDDAETAAANAEAAAGYRVGLARTTKAALDALTGPFDEGASAAVYADGANNGVYSYTSGSWVKVADLPEETAAGFAAQAEAAAEEVKLAEWPFDIRKREGYATLTAFQDFGNAAGTFTYNDDYSITLTAGVGNFWRGNITSQQEPIPEGSKILAVLEVKSGTIQNPALRIRAGGVSTDHVMTERYPGKWDVEITAPPAYDLLRIQVENAEAGVDTEIQAGYAVQPPGWTGQVALPDVTALAALQANNFAPAPGNLWPEAKSSLAWPVSGGTQLIHYGMSFDQGQTLFVTAQVKNALGEPAVLGAVRMSLNFAKKIGAFSGSGRNVTLRPVYGVPGLLAGTVTVTPIGSNGAGTFAVLTAIALSAKGTPQDAIIENVQVFNLPPPNYVVGGATPVFPDDAMVVENGDSMMNIWQPSFDGLGDRYVGFQDLDFDETAVPEGGVGSNWQRLIYAQRTDYTDTIAMQQRHVLTPGNTVNEFAIQSPDWASNDGSGGTTHKHQLQRAAPVLTIDGTTFDTNAVYRGTASEVVKDTFFDIYETGNMANKVLELDTRKTWTPGQLVLRNTIRPNQNIRSDYTFMAMLEIDDFFDDTDALREGLLIEKVTLPNQGDAEYSLFQNTVSATYPNETLWHIHTTLGFILEIELLSGWDAFPNFNTWLSTSVKYKFYASLTSILFQRDGYFGLPGATYDTLQAGATYTTETAYRILPKPAT